MSPSICMLSDHLNSKPPLSFPVAIDCLGICNSRRFPSTLKVSSVTLPHFHRPTHFSNTAIPSRGALRLTTKSYPSQPVLLFRSISSRSIIHLSEGAEMPLTVSA